MVRLHGGDLAAFEKEQGQVPPPHQVVAAADGFVASIGAQQVAQAAFELGAGRAQATDAIDPAAGVRLLVTRGDKVSAGQPLAELYAPATKPLVLEVVE